MAKHKEHKWGTSEHKDGKVKMACIRPNCGVSHEYSERNSSGPVPPPPTGCNGD